VEYQREGFSLFQNMMGQIREESIGFLFNLEVEVSGSTANAAVPTVEAKGLGQGGAPAERLSYSAPSADTAGGVEVRNQRGQLEPAATARAQQAQQQVGAAFAGPASQPAQQQPSGERGAFGQRTQAPAPAPVNRAQRRAQEKKKQR
jgi:preprotein translocase subunit SecA